jgi:UDP-glucuronate 4-epimerase
MSNQRILVTGAARFVGFHVCRQLLAEGRNVVGLDNLNNYYHPAPKQSRLSILRQDSCFKFVHADLADRPSTASLFAEYRFAAVLHLAAAQAGVRYSLEQPQYLVAFANVLEGWGHNGCGHLVCGSSSSVYGANTKLLFSVQDGTNHPVSLYAATKRANELMAYSYSQPFIPFSWHRPTLFHRLWPLGAAGHGDFFPVYQGDRGGSAD